MQAGAISAAARIKAGLIWTGGKIREGAMWSAARSREGFIWSAERLREGALWAAARAKAGANRAMERGKQAALLSGVRVKEGAVWTAMRAKEGAVWSGRKIADSGRHAWDRVVLPGVKRAASGASQAGARFKSGGAGFSQRAREQAIAFGAWSAKLPRAAWTALLAVVAFFIDRANAAKSVVVDARKRHAEAGAVARAARKEADAEPASAQEQKPPAKPWTALLIPVLDRVRAAKNVLIDARKRHAEASVAARAARKEVEEEARNRKAAAEKEGDTEPAATKEGEPPAKSKKKKKAKANQDSVEA
jgi:hypothetical protein